MRQTVLALLSLLLLTACDTTGSLQELRHATPSSDPYQAALAQLYQQYSEEKLARYDWWTSKYFADKGLMADYGRDIQPEDPARWGIREGLLQNLQDGREKLVSVLDANKAANPNAAAEAVVDYDRWVVVASDGWDTQRINDAHDRFYSAVDALASVQQAEAQVEQQAQPAVPVETTSTILYFPFDSTHMTPSAKAALAELVKYIRSAGPDVKITINGHADRVGADNYNMTLSQHRAVDVMRALEAAGIPKSQMQYFAFGSSDPAVPEPANKPEPRNRRVQIFLE